MATDQVVSSVLLDMTVCPTINGPTNRDAVWDCGLVGLKEPHIGTWIPH